MSVLAETAASACQPRSELSWPVRLCEVDRGASSIFSLKGMPSVTEKRPRRPPSLASAGDNHRRLSLSVSEAPSPRKLRNDSPGTMPPASRLTCVALGSHLLSALPPSPSPATPFWGLTDFRGSAAGSEGVDTLVPNSVRAKISARRRQPLTRLPSLLLLGRLTRR